jgi:hypothetical protein
VHRLPPARRTHDGDRPPSGVAPHPSSATAANSAPRSAAEQASWGSSIAVCTRSAADITVVRWHTRRDRARLQKRTRSGCDRGDAEANLIAVVDSNGCPFRHTMPTAADTSPARAGAVAQARDNLANVFATPDPAVRLCRRPTNSLSSGSTPSKSSCPLRLPRAGPQPPLPPERPRSISAPPPPRRRRPARVHTSSRSPSLGGAGSAATAAPSLEHYVASADAATLYRERHHHRRRPRLATAGRWSSASLDHVAVLVVVCVESRQAGIEAPRFSARCSSGSKGVRARFGHGCRASANRSGKGAKASETRLAPWSLARLRSRRRAARRRRGCVPDSQGLVEGEILRPGRQVSVPGRVGADCHRPGVRHRTDTKTGKQSREAFGVITDLSSRQTSPERIATILRAHWVIEAGSTPGHGLPRGRLQDPHFDTMRRSQPYRSTSALPIVARWSRTPGGPVTSSHSISPASSPASAYSL